MALTHLKKTRHGFPPSYRKEGVNQIQKGLSQIKAMDYEEEYSPVVRYPSIRVNYLLWPESMVWKWNKLVLLPSSYKVTRASFPTSKGTVWIEAVEPCLEQ